jgi:hypothetical protein
MNFEGPVYKYIEFCRNAETLWHKLQSGHWDWLGRKPDGQFVIGRPRRLAAEEGAISGTRSEGADARTGRHGVIINAWQGVPQKHWFSTWYEEPEKARAEYERTIRDWEETHQSLALAKVVLIENGQVTDEQFMVQLPLTNYQ